MSRDAVRAEWDAAAAGFDLEPALVAPVAASIVVVPLPDPVLWGKEIEDERYVLLAEV